MAGYSRTPLAQKLGLKPQCRLAFLNLPPDVEADLSGNLRDSRRVKRGELDFAMIFVQKQKALEREFPRFAARLIPDGMLWVSWPKKSSGVACDLSETDVRRIGLSSGLVDVKVCAVSEVWSGLKFVIRLKDRARAAKKIS